MDLLIDAGNTNIKFAFSDRGRIKIVSRQQLNDSLLIIERVAVANVGKQIEVDDLLSQLKETAQITTASVKALQNGIACGYKNTSNLGIDRWLAILGATQKFPNENLIVVDAGTALTIDAVTNQGQHIGGWIIPGLQLMQQAIVERAPLVFTGDNIQPEVFGTDTPSAVLHGCLNALTGAIERAQYELEKHQKAVGDTNVTLVLTGGDAQTIAAHLDQPLVINTELVFKGLAALLDE